jgi:peptidyl-prolyl cis-trans isomerase A (cyclophilin A)
LTGRQAAPGVTIAAMRTIVWLTGALIAAGGCSKKPDTEKLEVRPPTAGDLDRYTADLEGDGPLMAKIETSKGTLTCELFADGAPLTVANFVGLARGLHPFRDANGAAQKRPFYNGLTFHRVIPGFMIQGGDPDGTGSGGPGYKFATEVSPQLKHDRAGIMSMANAGPNTNGSQFFIMDGVRSDLDGKYNVFGVCNEAEVVSAIAGVETTAANGEKSRPVDPPTIVKVEIYRGK